MGVARVPKIWGCWDHAPLGQRVRVADPYQYAILRRVTQARACVTLPNLFVLVQTVRAYAYLQRSAVKI